MIYITGDIHGDFNRYIAFAVRFSPTEDDVMIVLGDAGLNYYKGKKDIRVKKFVSDFAFTTFCIHGNHEMRPQKISNYKTKEYCGGIVWYEEEFPNILFAKDGEVYDFDGYKCIVIGGAYSVDKYYRLANGWSWFPDEQPSKEIKAYVEAQLAAHENKILTHLPAEIRAGRGVFSDGRPECGGQDTEAWLDKIEERLDYKKWYCGHFHTAKKIDKLQFMSEDIDVLG